ncbi:hypothetical protein ON010_g9431 [Phytophthora cinnamomi]|nr:hypothetical protein ON010_g9431 [Phytophthora cinnamomi]
MSQVKVWIVSAALLPDLSALVSDGAAGRGREVSTSQERERLGAALDGFGGVDARSGSGNGGAAVATAKVLTPSTCEVS